MTSDLAKAVKGGSERLLAGLVDSTVRGYGRVESCDGGR